MGYLILVHAENGKHKINGWGQSIDVPTTKYGQKKKFGANIKQKNIYIYILFRFEVCITNIMDNYVIIYSYI